MPSRVDKRKIVIDLKIEWNNYENTSNSVVKRIKPLNESKCFISRKSHSLIATGIAPVPAHNQIFRDSGKGENEKDSSLYKTSLYRLSKRLVVG